MPRRSGSAPLKALSCRYSRSRLRRPSSSRGMAPDSVVRVIHSCLRLRRLPSSGGMPPDSASGGPSGRPLMRRRVSRESWPSSGGSEPLSTFATSEEQPAGQSRVTRPQLSVLTPAQSPKVPVECSCASKSPTAIRSVACPPQRKVMAEKPGVTTASAKLSRAAPICRW